MKTKVSRQILHCILFFSILSTTTVLASEPQTAPQLETTNTIVTARFLIAIIFVIIVLVWNFTLRKKIAESTSQLKQYSNQLADQVKEQTAQLSYTNDRLESLFHYMPNGFAEHELIFDKKGNPIDYRFIDINPAFSEQTGLSEDIIGKTVKTVLPNIEEEWIKRVAKVAMTGKPMVFDSYTKDLDKHFRIHAFSRKQGHFAILFDDVSERKKMEYSLHESNQRLDAAIKGAKLGLWDWNLKNSQLITNTLWHTMLGYDENDSDNEIVDKFFELIHPDDLAAIQQQITDNLSGKRNYFHAEIRMLCKDGNYKWILANGNVIERGIDEKAVRMVGIHMDIDESKRLQSTLLKAKEIAENAAQTKSDFLANMSHEIRTPLNAVIGFGYLMEKSGLTPQQAEFLNKMQTSANHLLGVINDILDFSKIDANALQLDKTEFLIEKLLKDVSEINAEQGRVKNLEMLYVHNETESSYFVGDFLRLTQILNNLISNAIKFTHKGSITVEAKILSKLNNKCKIQFSVKDTGIGLTEEQTASLFQPFSQADQSTTRKYGGTGLGLSICKKLVDLMGGTIEVKSIPDQGTTFSFSVDLELGGTVKQDIAEIQQLSSLKILIIDDMEELAKTLKVIIGKHVNTVDYATSAEEGLHILETAEQPYDLVLLDRSMPNMDGITACKKIKAHNALKKIPRVILCTGLLEENIKQDEVGYDSYILKPATKSNVLKTIKSLFHGSQQKNIAQTQQPTGSHEPSQLNHAHILLVEDNQINQEVATSILQTTGCKIIIANNGKEAIELIDQHPINLVLMDIQMPIMDGYQATKLLRQNDKYKDLPILAMTANILPEDREKSFAVGMNDYITKPISPELLLSTVKRWLQQKSLQPNNHQPPASYLSNSIPKIKGIDLEKGLYHTANKEALYRKILLKFAETNQNVVDNIKTALSNQDTDTAIRIAHSLKGIAATIGANTIQEIATKTLNTLRQNPEQNIDQLLDETALLLSETIDDIKQQLHS